MKVTLEVCVDRAESAKAAALGGADRLEICGALGVGGVTPSLGLVEQCREQAPALNHMVMVRPHEGNFCYDDGDRATMLKDLRLFQRAGVDGIVFGALMPDLSIDTATCRQLIDAARPLEITFHRAFDMAREPLRALDDLLQLGVDRVLTSGQVRSAEAGIPLLRRLVEASAGALSVMPGAGISHVNVGTIVRATGAHEIHLSGSRREPPVGNQQVMFGRDSRVTESERILAARRAIDETGETSQGH